MVLGGGWCYLGGWCSHSDLSENGGGDASALRVKPAVSPTSDVVRKAFAAQQRRLEQQMLGRISEAGRRKTRSWACFFLAKCLLEVKGSSDMLL